MSSALEPDSSADGDPLHAAVVRLAPGLREFAALRIRGTIARLENPQDVVQSVCRQLLAMGDRVEFRGDAPLRALLERMVGQKISEKCRYHTAARRDATRVIELEPDQLTPAVPPDPVDAAAYHELRGRLAEALGELPQADAEILMWSGMLGMSHAEIAAQLGVTVETARARLKRARDRLRGRLASCGFRVA